MQNITSQAIDVLEQNRTMLSTGKANIQAGKICR